jgi:hypothetical protein
MRQAFRHHHFGVGVMMIEKVLQNGTAPWRIFIKMARFVDIDARAERSGP